MWRCRRRALALAGGPGAARRGGGRGRKARPRAGAPATFWSNSRPGRRPRTRARPGSPRLGRRGGGPARHRSGRPGSPVAQSARGTRADAHLRCSPRTKSAEVDPRAGYHLEPRNLSACAGRQSTRQCTRGSDECGAEGSGTRRESHPARSAPPAPADVDHLPHTRPRITGSAQNSARGRQRGERGGWRRTGIDLSMSSRSDLCAAAHGVRGTGSSCTACRKGRGRRTPFESDSFKRVRRTCCRMLMRGEFVSPRISDFGFRIENWTFHPRQGAFPDQRQDPTESRPGVPQTPFRIR